MVVCHAVVDKLEAGYTLLQATTASQCHSLLKKHLSRAILDKLKHHKTEESDATLLDVIQSGLVNLDSSVGLYAPDAESYTLFADLIDPIIHDYHHGLSNSQLHPPGLNFGDPNELTNIDPEGLYILSTRIRCARNLNNYPFQPHLSVSQYHHIEETVLQALATLQHNPDLAGTYTPLSDISEPTQKKLINQHLLFAATDRFLAAANARRFWPRHRGIYINRAQTFLVWLNEEDNLRIISMEEGGDLRSVYARFIAGVRRLSENMAFAHSERLGYLTCCPSNLGTAMRASVLIRLPYLSRDMAQLRQWADRNNLQIRGTNGEHSDPLDAVFDVSNKRRLGLTEWEVMMEVQKGILEIFERERALELPSRPSFS